MPERPRLTAAVADLRRAVREGLALASIQPGESVLLAVSGGGDSLALAAAIAFEAPRQSIRAHALIIDHGLQPGSAQIAQTALASCQALGLDGQVRRVSVQKSGAGLEAEARAARYAELERVREELGARCIVLGHNLNDQAETVLLGLTRGSGLKSIAGMSQWDPERKLLRPLVGIDREKIRQSLKDQGIQFWDDPHNQDPRFTRVRIRELLKHMEAALGPGLSSALAQTASIAAGAEDFLQLAANELEKMARTRSTARSQSYDVVQIAQSHPALIRQTLRAIALKLGAKNLSMSQIESMSELVTNWHGQKSIPLSGITVERVNNELVFQTNKPLTAGASCS